MNSATVHFARLQETTSQCVLTFCHAVFPVLRLPALRLNMCSHCVTQCFPCYVSLPCPAPRLNMHSHCVTQCFPCYVSLPCPAPHLNMHSHCVTQCFPCYVSLPCPALPCVSICAHTVSHSVSHATSPCPASQYALTLCHAVFPVLRLPALCLNVCPALQPCNGSFINIYGAYNSDYAMFPPAAKT